MKLPSFEKLLGRRSMKPKRAKSRPWQQLLKIAEGWAGKGKGVGDGEE